MIKKTCKSIFLIILYILITSFSYAQEKNTLHIYGWANYIEPKIIKEFEQETGISVVYDVYDSEEMLDAKMMLGNTGYDIVFPSSGPALTNQINEKVYHKINKNKITLYKDINQDILNKLLKYDPNNQYTIPWLWGVTGVGYNKKIKDIVPHDIMNSLKIVFDPQILKKISNKCKIEWFYSPPELISLALIYNGIPPQPLTVEKLNIVKITLQKARPYISKISNSSYSIDLVKNNACLSIGWLGDIDQTIHNTNNKTTDIQLFTTGFIMTIDNIAIPKDSKNIEAAYKFINFLLRPHISAQVTNYTRNMNTNLKSYPYISKQILNNHNLNPPAHILKNGYTLAGKSINLTRLQNRIWTYIVSNIQE